MYMDSIFNAIFIPGKFFGKTKTSYLASFFSYVFIFLMNLFSYKFIFYSIIIFYNLKAVPIFIFLPIISFFISFGIDLIFIHDYNNNRIKMHYGQTYSPFIFLPIGIALIKSSSLYFRIAGWSFCVFVITWSALLFFILTENLKSTSIKITKDFCIVFFILSL